MSVLSIEEQRRRLGVSAPPGTPEPGSKTPPAQASAASVGAPSSFFWGTPANPNYVSPVRDQGGCGSCVAFGTTAVAESMVRIQQGNPGLDVDLSEAQLFFCHGPATGASCESNGWWPTNAFDAYRDLGVADEACFPYDAAATGCAACPTGPTGRRRSPATPTSPTTRRRSRTGYSTRGPVETCFYVYNDFFSYKSGVYRHVSGDLAGGHCVAIVGYDDAGGYWMCKNSWTDRGRRAGSASPTATPTSRTRGA